jgi:2-iminobutanoate/2-iminopropanoate deaminase
MDKIVHDFGFLIKGGPYSHIIEANGFLFVSGQSPIDIEKNILIFDDVKSATELTLNNIKRMLEAAGSEMSKVVKTTVYLKDMADFNAMNEIYKTFFPANPPARTCIAAKEVPGNFQVEIEAIAIK